MIEKITKISGIITENKMLYGDAARKKIVVEFENIISIMAMNNSANTNVGGYPTTVVRNYLNSALYNQMPTDLKNVIKTTRVISGHGTNDSDNFTTTDRIYLLSSMEVFGEDEYDSAASTTTQFDFYRINGSELRHFTGGPPQGYYVQVQIGADKKHPSGYNDWWFRNADSSGDLTYRAVGQEGGITTPSPHGEIMKSGVSPAFRVG